MTIDPGFTRTTVTLFGSSDPLDQALSSQLDQRGCKTHSVTVATGWLQSVTHAIMRLDTVAGAEAFKQLADTPAPRSHVVAVCPETDDVADEMADHLSVGAPAFVTRPFTLESGGH